MSFGERPVGSLGQRSVYKTEFDLFKQNSDLDLISLVSYKNDIPNDSEHLLAIQARASRERFINTRFVNSRDSNNFRSRGPVSIHRNINEKTYSREDKFQERSSKSAVNLHAQHITRVDNRSQTACGSRNTVNARKRSQTTCGIRKKETSWNISTHVSKIQSQARFLFRRSDHIGFRGNEQHYTSAQINKGDRVNIDSKYKGIRAKVNTSTANVNINRRSKSAYVPINYGNKANKEITKPSTHQLKKDVKLERCKITDGTRVGNIKPTSPSEKITLIEIDYSGKDETDGELIASVELPHSDSETVQESATNIHLNVDCFSVKELESDETDDFLDFKDSGFASTSLTPEFNTSVERNIALDGEEHKHVTFGIASETADEDDVRSKVDSDIVAIDECKRISTEAESQKDVDEFISNIELRDCDSRLGNDSVSICETGVTVNSENNSLCAERINERIDSDEKANVEEESVKSDKDEQTSSTQMIHPSDIKMSKEARCAIMETLHAMKLNGYKDTNGNNSANIRNKGVTTQKRIKDNRNKYEHYISERTDTFIRNQHRSNDGKGRHNDGHGSAFSSDNAKECDESSSEELVKGKLFPSIGDIPQKGKKTKTSLTNSTALTSETSSGKVFSLEQAKKKKYRIPGIGNYNLVMSPENDFEITPPGFDSRYNAGAIISKEEQEPPPRFIQDQSIQKCTNWLRNVNLSPLTLKPVINKR